MLTFGCGTVTVRIFWNWLSTYSKSCGGMWLRKEKVLYFSTADTISRLIRQEVRWQMTLILLHRADCSQNLKKLQSSQPNVGYRDY
jgi:hypothetical protein